MAPSIYEFRGFSLVENKWVYGSLIKKGENTFILTDQKKAELHPVDIKSIGIKMHCNSQKLFTGDIVINSTWTTMVGLPWEICWDEYYGGRFIAKNDKMGYKRENPNNLTRCEIIGTMFENPKLLDNKKKKKKEPE